MLVIGYAVTTDVKHVATAVYDLDNSAGQPRPDRPRFVRSGYFDVVAHVDDDAAGPRPARPRRGAASCCGSTTASPRTCGPAAPPGCRCIVDGTDSNTAGIVLQLRRPGSPAATREQMLLDRLDAAAGAAPPRPAGSTCERRAWFNENLESRNFYVPGVIVDRRHAGHAAADEHGRGAREGDRHDGADHGHADHARSSSSWARPCRSR